MVRSASWAAPCMNSCASDPPWMRTPRFTWSRKFCSSMVGSCRSVVWTPTTRCGCVPPPRAREDGPMSRIQRFDHVGITVADLDAAAAFFVGLGFEAEGRMPMQGEFVDTVIGIQDSRSEIVMLRPPDGGTGLELSSFVHPEHKPGSPAAMSNELGIRNVAFEVDNLDAIIDRL